MIHQFAYSRASSDDEAGRDLAEPRSAPLGGGTDLVVCIRENLTRPDRLVDLTRIPGARTVEWRDGGRLRVGGAVRLAALGADAQVGARGRRPAR